MEGSCGKIIILNNQIVNKIVHRSKNKTHFINSLRAPQQYHLQKLCSSITQTYSTLFVPKVYSYDTNSYRMERIDVSQYIHPNDVDTDELINFYNDCKKYNIYPADFELYKQPNGKIALIDFDKFGVYINDTTIEFPWGERLNLYHTGEFSYW
jgi:hypothetical protein